MKKYRSYLPYAILIIFVLAGLYASHISESDYFGEIMLGLFTLFGLYNAYDGYMLLFNERYLVQKEQTIWKEDHKTEEDEKHARFYNKYTRGSTNLLLGVLILGIVINAVLEKYFSIDLFGNLF